MVLFPVGVRDVLFSKAHTQAVRPNQPLIQRTKSALPGASVQGVNSPLHLVPSSKMSGAKRPLHLTTYTHNECSPLVGRYDVAERVKLCKT